MRGEHQDPGLGAERHGLRMGHRRRRHGGETESPETQEAGGRTTTRVQLEMPAQAMERLSRLKERSEAASYAEVVRNALRLYEALADEYDKGAEFFVKRADGESVAYKIFV